MQTVNYLIYKLSISIKIRVPILTATGIFVLLETRGDLAYKGLHSAIMLKDNRLKKKDGNKQVWQEMVRTEEYQQGRRERYKIERKFGEAKVQHGLGRCRYISCTAIV